MQSSRSSDLRAAKRQLHVDLAATQATLKKARRSVIDSARAEARQWEMSGAVGNAVLCMYWLAGAVDPAVKYLRSVARQRAWPQKSDGDIGDIVAACFADADVPTLVQLTNPDAPLYEKAAKLAACCVQQWKMHVWALDLNVFNSVAPTTAAVLRECEQLRASLGADVIHPPSRLCVSNASARKWATRWRLRWGGRFAALRPHDQPPVPEMNARAPVSSHSFVWFLGRFFL